MKNSEIHAVHSHHRRPQRKKTPLWKKLFMALVVIMVICVAGAGAGFLLSITGTLPDVSQTLSPAASSQIYDCKGRLITTVHAEQNRLPVKLADTPKDLQNAFIAAEDIRFYKHHGIDPIGIARAVVSNIRHRDATGQGGSTITQQLARNAFLTQEQTLKRKLLEAVLAVEIENKYTKAEILEMYMNQIYFGQGAYGVQTASHVYFGKDVKDLNLAQCAMLAGLPNSPNYYSPFHNLQAAKYRQGVVLDQMAKYGYISQEQANEAKAQDLGLVKPGSNQDNNKLASYFVNYVVQQVSDKYDSSAIYKEGLKIYTTLDLDMQKDAENAVNKDLPKGTKNAKGITQPQGALLAIETKTGDVKAMVGGRGEDQFNRATQMYRQPGSAFKPFTYVTALEKDMSPNMMLDNSAVSFAGGWSPKNYGHTTGGPVTMTEALVKSMNIPTINLANKVGMSNVIKTAEKCGISSLVDSGKYSDNNLSASIGGLSKGVSLWDMAQAYSVFANNGQLIKPRVILKIEDRNGNILEDHTGESDAEQVLDANAVARLNVMLQQAVMRGTGRNAYFGRPVAGKTGTTNGAHDAWFVGYTPNMVTAVWIGDDTSTNAGYTGGTIPATIFRDFMSQATASQSASSFNIPASIQGELAKAQNEAKAADQQAQGDEAVPDQDTSTTETNTQDSGKNSQSRSSQDKSDSGKKHNSSPDQARKSAAKAGKNILDQVAGQ
ncbi:PBP1A family penicillin-binding protein [Allisonella histaminiformans]|uniref:PBP1A family penicillin-binding protein n=1 Tax=Allisonella histaminiformans TaxID=209880 RepID=UPI003522131E